MSTYARYPIAFERGEGGRLWDTQGRCHLDFLTGLSVNNLGHAHPQVVAAVREQVGKLIHTSNLYRIPNQEALAERLTATCFADQAFFGNSGAEANEAAIKLARKYMKEHGKPERFAIVTAVNSFHGRTLATLTATGQEKVQKGYDPLPEGFHYATYNDVGAMKKLLKDKKIGPTVAAILVEPIQGEAGVRIPDDDYLPALRQLADRFGVLLILDEVQTGMGRTGKLWCHQWSGITPDIMTISKALASGLPMGACLATAQVAESFTHGSHGSTFGGNPLCSAAALATLSVLLDQGVLDKVESLGNYFLKRLTEVRDRHKLVKDARGKGLMAALELNAPGEEVASLCLSRGLLINCCMGTVLRFLPPLTVTFDEIDEAVNIIDGVLMDLF